MAKRWSFELHMSGHAGAPDRTGMAPQRPSKWLRVEDRGVARWVEVTHHGEAMRTILDLVRGAVEDVIEDGAAVVPVRGEDG